MTRRIVLDANIVIRAVLGARVPALIAHDGEDVSFFAPAHVFAEAGRHLPGIAASRGHDPAGLVDALEALRAVVDTVASEATEPLRSAAMVRIGERDPADWPVVAAALALNCPIWTEDRDFFGAGVPTWTTATVETCLRGD